MRIVPPSLPNSKNWCSWGANTSVHDWICPFLALLLYCTQGEVPVCKVSNKTKQRKKNTKTKTQISVPKKSGTKAQCLSLRCLKYGDISYKLQRLYANSLLPRARTGLKGEEATTCPPSGMHGQPCRAVKLQQPEILPPPDISQKITVVCKPAASQLCFLLPLFSSNPALK